MGGPYRNLYKEFKGGESDSFLHVCCLVIRGLTGGFLML